MGTDGIIVEYVFIDEDGETVTDAVNPNPYGKFAIEQDTLN